MLLRVEVPRRIRPRRLADRYERWSNELCLWWRRNTERLWNEDWTERITPVALHARRQKQTWVFGQTEQGSVCQVRKSTAPDDKLDPLCCTNISPTNEKRYHIWQSVQDFILLPQKSKCWTIQIVNDEGEIQLFNHKSSRKTKIWQLLIPTRHPRPNMTGKSHQKKAVAGN